MVDIELRDIIDGFKDPEYAISRMKKDIPTDATVLEGRIRDAGLRLVGASQGHPARHLVTAIGTFHDDPEQDAAVVSYISSFKKVYRTLYLSEGDKGTYDVPLSLRINGELARLGCIGPDGRLVLGELGFLDKQMAALSDELVKDKRLIMVLRNEGRVKVRKIKSDSVEAKLAPFWFEHKSEVRFTEDIDAYADQNAANARYIETMNGKQIPVPGTKEYDAWESLFAGVVHGMASRDDHFIFDATTESRSRPVILRVGAGHIIGGTLGKFMEYQEVPSILLLPDKPFKSFFGQTSRIGS
jgi:hypothetical protein